MFEKVNPSHPDKVADRIAGAIVDLAYRKTKNPKIAVEVLVGHGRARIIIETNADIWPFQVDEIVERIAPEVEDIETKIVPQDEHLAQNQIGKLRCGDNGIFKGMPVSREEAKLAKFAAELYKTYHTDGKFIIRPGLAEDEFIICQSCGDDSLEDKCSSLIGPNDQIYAINPLGDWTGGVNVDTGATNRKLGSDMGEAATGGGLHGKDLSKADVSVNIVAHILAERAQKPVTASCAIGDQEITFDCEGEKLFVEYAEVVKKAGEYIKSKGGFEKFAEWGLIDGEKVNV